MLHLRAYIERSCRIKTYKSHVRSRRFSDYFVVGPMMNDSVQYYITVRRS